MNSTPFSMTLSNKLILASGSPRRKQLLSEAGFKFEVKTVPFEEVFPEDMNAGEVAEFLAKGKNEAHRDVFKDEVILTADTVVILDNMILGKPSSEEEAISVISKLSGRTHQVITGVCISDSNKTISFSSTTEVKFRTLASNEIKHYVHSYKPMDKAGSYAIQEWIGLIGIESIKGSYFNVVGLPIDQVYQTMKEHFKNVSIILE